MQITFKGDKAVKDLDATIKNIQNRVPTILNEVGITGVANIQNSIDAITPHPPINKGTYRAGINYRVDGNQLTVSDSIIYGKYIEFGQPPHYIAINIIIDWCKEKGIITNDKDIGIAYAIQKHIAKYGVNPKPAFRTGISLTEQRISEIFRHYYK